MSSYGQPGTSSLPSPAGWEKRPLGGWAASVVIVVLALVMAAVAVSLAGQDGRDAIIAGAISVVLLAASVLARPKARTAPAHAIGVEVDGVHSAGIRFPIRPPSRMAGLAMVVAGLGFVALGGAAVVVGIRDGQGSAIIGFVVLTGLGSIFLLGGYAGLRSSRADLGMDLTESHVVVGLGFDRVALPWRDITRVEATSIRWRTRFGMPAQVQHWLLIAGAPDSELLLRRREHPRMLGRAAGRIAGDVMVAIPTSRIGSDPVVVFHALRHYLEQPDDRVHLTTGAAAGAWPESAQPR